MNTVPRLALTGAAVTLAVVMALAVTGLSSTVMAQTPSDDATLSSLTVSPRDIIGFDRDRGSYEVGVASTVTRATVSATAADANATVSITPDDVDGVPDGHQVDLSAGRNAVTVTVTAEDGVTTMDYTVSVNRGVTALTGWKAVDDLDGLIAAGNDAPQGIWSDGTTMWVSDIGTGKLYAYRLSDGARDAAKDFDTLIAAGNANPTGIWSDGTTMWVADVLDDKLYAYRMSNKEPDSDKDFDTLSDASNGFPFGLWSDGTTMWVADSGDGKLYAYRLSVKERDPDRDFDTLIAAGNGNPRGIWSDGATMWVADGGDGKLYTYRMSDRTPVPARDFETLSAAGNGSPRDIWSDGTTMWVVEWFSDKVYSYNRAPGDATLSSLTVSPRDIIGFDRDRGSYEVGVASTVTQATVSANAADANATVSITPDDVDGVPDGHQVDLSAGRNAVTVTVTAEDGVTTMDYTVSVNRGVTALTGWKAVDDLDGLIAAGNDDPSGIWSDGTTMWVSDVGTGKLYAYRLSDGARDAAKDFDTLIAAGNANPTGIWSDGTTMWVADILDDKLYAYRMSNKEPDSDKDFDTLSDASNGFPFGLWSDGTTMWVADGGDGKLYAYRLSVKERDPDRDFDTPIAAGNGNPTGIWSDGATMWVADASDDKLYTYRMSDRTPVPARDFETLSAAGNGNPRDIWSDGATMWVTDGTDDKVYSYNRAPGDATLYVAPPANLEAIIGNMEVTLVWDNPRNPAITKYQYRVRPSASTTWRPDWTDIPGSHADTTSFRVRNLVNGTEYTFEVRAVESPSALSDASSVTETPLQPTVPAAPWGLGLAQRDGALLAYWNEPPKLPTTHLAPITSYQVRFRLYGSSQAWTYISRDGDTSRSQLLAGLINRKPYEVEVAAVNRIGTGPWAANSAVPQPVQSKPDNADAVDDLTFPALAALWVDGYASEIEHPDRDPWSTNTIWNSCLSQENSMILWIGANVEYRGSNVHQAPLEHQVHVNTDHGAGEFRTEFRPSSHDAEITRLFGTVNLHKYSGLTVWIRARFAAHGDRPAGWTQWSDPVNLLCFDQERPGSSDQQEGQLQEIQNSPATGKPAITGTPELDETLTATTSGVSDLNGTDDATFAYQWLRYDGSSNTPIAGATGQTYTVAQADVDQEIKVRVSFTDDDGFDESLTSNSVYVQPPPPLYGRFINLPEDGHNGSDPFTLQVEFNYDISIGWEEFRDHSFTIEGGAVTHATRVNKRHDLWQITVKPDGDGDVTISLTPDGVCTVAGAICNKHSMMLNNRPEKTIPGPQQPENSPATGAPSITGTAQVGETLTADTSGIFDEDGLDNVSFACQWLADDAEIHDATGSTYTLANADEGKTIRVRVSFTDDAGNDEAVTSAATGTVEARPNSPATGAPSITGTAELGETLTADTSGISDDNGTDDATFAYQWLRIHDGTETEISGANASSYAVTLDDADRDIKVRVSFTDDDGFDETVTSPGIHVPQPAPLTAEFTNLPEDGHDGSDSFTLQVEFNHDIKIGWEAFRDHSFTVSGGDVTHANRVNKQRDLWQVTVRPDGDDDVSISLTPNRACTTSGAICNSHGMMLSNEPQVTISGP